MKEKRVYIIPAAVLDGIDWSDYFGSEDFDYDDISDNVWMDIAESDGYVYTLEGFVLAWEKDNGFPSREYNYARIIDIES